MNTIDIVELILFFIIGGLAGYGLAAWQEDKKKIFEREMQKWNKIYEKLLTHKNRKNEKENN